MTDYLKPSLTAYSDVLRSFVKLDSLAAQASGLSVDTVTKIQHVAHAINQAERTALNHREHMLRNKDQFQGQGTDAWQKSNFEPFVAAARQAKTLLSDEGFVQELVNSSIVVPEGEPQYSRLRRDSEDYSSLTSAYELTSKARTISEVLHREETARSHTIRDRDVGRYAISFDRNPFQPV
ncbi:MAG: hypothetical protein GW903_00965 [Alphaproteobacteria bacterium]|nr:hypothetical protein [Alphaproteobacteria bacterium]NCQ87540.1 hypothetical protein [Alphaproteobacteria bacterium]NCT06408.1 hypothetical protein [Alphaproteobacteria bacterium]